MYMQIHLSFSQGHCWVKIYKILLQTTFIVHFKIGIVVLIKVSSQKEDREWGDTLDLLCMGYSHKDVA